MNLSDIGSGYLMIYYYIPQYHHHQEHARYGVLLTRSLTDHCLVCSIVKAYLTIN
jgi:hypothetical protein